jgi:hypothetical protein
MDRKYERRGRRGNSFGEGKERKGVYSRLIGLVVGASRGSGMWLPI